MEKRQKPAAGAESVGKAPFAPLACGSAAPPPTSERRVRTHSRPRTCPFVGRAQFASAGRLLAIGHRNLHPAVHNPVRGGGAIRPLRGWPGRAFPADANCARPTCVCTRPSMHSPPPSGAARWRQLPSLRPGRPRQPRGGRIEYRPVARRRRRRCSRRIRAAGRASAARAGLSQVYRQDGRGRQRG